MHCKHCGEYLPEGTKFCSSCGRIQDKVIVEKKIEKEIDSEEDLQCTRIIRKEEVKSLEDTTEMEAIDIEDPIYEVDPYENRKKTSEVLKIKRKPKEESKDRFQEELLQEKPKFIFPWKRKKEDSKNSSEYEDFKEKEFKRDPFVRNEVFEEEPEIRYYPEHDVPKIEGNRFRSIPLFLLLILQLLAIIFILPFTAYVGGSGANAIAVGAILLVISLIIHQLSYRRASKKAGVFLGRDRRGQLTGSMLNLMMIPFTITLVGIYFMFIVDRELAIIVFLASTLAVLILMKTIIKKNLREVIYDKGILNKFASKYRGRYFLLSIVLPILLFILLNAIIGFNIPYIF